MNDAMLEPNQYAINRLVKKINPRPLSTILAKEPVKRIVAIAIKIPARPLVISGSINISKMPEETITPMNIPATPKGITLTIHIFHNSEEGLFVLPRKSIFEVSASINKVRRFFGFSQVPVPLNDD